MLDNCKKIKEQAKLAYDQVTDAYQQINGTLQDIKEHRDKMAWVSRISDQKALTTTNITCCTFLRTRFTKNSNKKANACPKSMFQKQINLPNWIIVFVFDFTFAMA